MNPDFNGFFPQYPNEQLNNHSIERPESSANGQHASSDHSILDYLDQILVEEDVDQMPSFPPDAVQTAERLFYESLGVNYPYKPIPGCSSPWQEDYQYQSSSEGEFAKQYRRGLQEATTLLHSSVSTTSTQGMRSRKRVEQAGVCENASIGTDFLDMVLLPSPNPKGCSVHHDRKRISERKRSLVDISALLNVCAKSVASGDLARASELLIEIRRHACSTGDSMQRLACYFADGLEARIAGNGSRIYTFIISRPLPSYNFLRLYHMLNTSIPFRKVTTYFSNETILQAAADSSKLHIIDLGISFGFQWPSLMKQIAVRPEGPPMLRITGIEFPNCGLKTQELLNETGYRLAHYASRFNVPFEYRAIIQEVEMIQLEDLRIEDDEVVVVNCVHRFLHLDDESVMSHSVKDVVLRLVKSMKPKVFFLATVNAGYSVPFFLTRFREALFHYSTLFDVFDTFWPADLPGRTAIEELYGTEALNVIACEGRERMARPETYRRWNMKNSRMGFRQVPLYRELIEGMEDKGRSVYHKDFLVDQVGDWVMLGWKGRYLYGISCWEPIS